KRIPAAASVVPGWRILPVLAPCYKRVHKEQWFSFLLLPVVLGPLQLRSYSLKFQRQRPGKHLISGVEVISRSPVAIQDAPAHARRYGTKEDPAGPVDAPTVSSSTAALYRCRLPARGNTRPGQPRRAAKSIPVLR